LEKVEQDFVEIGHTSTDVVERESTDLIRGGRGMEKWIGTKTVRRLVTTRKVERGNEKSQNLRGIRRSSSLKNRVRPRGNLARSKKRNLKRRERSSTGATQESSKSNSIASIRTKPRTGHSENGWLLMTLRAAY